MSELETLPPPTLEAPPEPLVEENAPWRHPPFSPWRRLGKSAARVTLLLGVDLLAFVALRAGIRAIRDGWMVGADVAETVRANLPTGYLGGWQFATAMIIGLVAAGAYARGEAWKDGRRVFIGVLLATGLTLWHSLWTLGVPYVVLQGVITGLVVGGAVFAGRVILAYVVPLAFPRSRYQESVLVVGRPSDPTSRAFARRLLGGKRMVLTGWVHSSEDEIGPGYRGPPEQIWRILSQTQPDTVLLIGQLRPSVFQSVLEAATAAQCRILSLSGYDGLGSLSPRLWWHRGLPFVVLDLPHLTRPQYLVKRIIDLIGSGLGLVLLSPLFALLALSIKFESAGPVFFRQERAGFGGRVFRMLKFRSMRDGADNEKDALAHLNHTGDHRLFKIPSDPRVTRLGAFLRRWSLDELPQLFNVFVGDMSLVGPRPFFEGDLAHYRDHHFGRLAAKPGITGLWQINGRSSVVDFEDVVRLDREYIDRWSLWLDLKILARTVPAVLRRTGAY